MAPKDPKVELLKQIPLFSGLGSHDLDRIAQLMDEVDVTAGTVLMTQGHQGHEMFVVVSGRLGIERDGQLVAESGPGESLGVMALLAEGPRTATVTAIEPSRLLVAGHREFHALMAVSSEIRTHILETLVHQVRNLDASAVH